jgi:predicted nucleic acid-binding protein
LRQLKVVSNTTPVLSLIKIGKLELLKNLFGNIIVPFAVYEEMEAGKDRAFYVNLCELEWIKIEKIDNPKVRSYLLDLDEGEAETPVLAKEIAPLLQQLQEKQSWLSANLIESALKIAGEAKTQ